jgi:hypothetical protein
MPRPIKLQEANPVFEFTTIQEITKIKISINNFILKIDSCRHTPSQELTIGLKCKKENGICNYDTKNKCHDYTLIHSFIESLVNFTSSELKTKFENHFHIDVYSWNDSKSIYLTISSPENGEDTICQSKQVPIIIALKSHKACESPQGFDHAKRLIDKKVTLEFGHRNVSIAP